MLLGSRVTCDSCTRLVDGMFVHVPCAVGWSTVYTLFMHLRVYTWFCNGMNVSAGMRTVNALTWK